MSNGCSLSAALEGRYLGYPDHLESISIQNQQDQLSAPLQQKEHDQNEPKSVAGNGVTGKLREQPQGDVSRRSHLIMNN